MYCIVLIMTKQRVTYVQKDSEKESREVTLLLRSNLIYMCKRRVIRDSILNDNTN